MCFVPCPVNSFILLPTTWYLNDRRCSSPIGYCTIISTNQIFFKAFGMRHFVIDHLGRKERESAMRKECSTLALGQLVALFWP
jgi:hypothetical protein